MPSRISASERALELCLRQARGRVAGAQRDATAWHRAAVVRFCNVTGPRQSGRYGMVAPRFIRQALSGQPITVFGDGTQSRSFCAVGDAIRGGYLHLGWSARQGGLT